MISSKQAQKSANERKAFSMFAEKMGWLCDELTMSSRPEPEPDILFKAGVVLIAFELVEMCDSTLAHQTALIRDTGGVFTTWTSDPTAQIIGKKLSKSYSTDYPIELLCYWNAMVISPDSQIAEEINLALESRSDHPFQVVWYFGEKSIYKWLIAENHCSKLQFDNARDPFWVDWFF